MIILSCCNLWIYDYLTHPVSVLSTEHLSRCLRECASGRISPRGEGPREAPAWKFSQARFLSPAPGICGVGQLSAISQGLFCLGTKDGAGDLSAPLILVSVEMGSKRKPRISLSQWEGPCENVTAGTTLPPSVRGPEARDGRTWPGVMGQPVTEPS